MKQTASSRKAILEDLSIYLSNSAIKISVVISFVTTVLNFISLLGDYRRTIRLVLILLTAAIITIWLCLLYIYRKKDEVIAEHIYYDGDPQVIINNRYTEKVRRLVLVGMVILPLVMFSVIGWVIINNFSSSETIILVSNLRGNADEQSTISDYIRSRLRELPRQRIYLKVVKPSENILEEDKREFAEKMQEYNASITLTGWCSGNPGKLRGEIFFYDSSSSPIDTISIREEISQSPTINDYATISEQLANKINYKMAFIIGRKLYEGKDYDGAIELLNAADDQLKRAQELIESGDTKPTDILSAGKVYYYRGLAYFHKGHHDAALGDFTKAIRNSLEKDLAADAHYHRGLCYRVLAISSSFLDEQKLKCAIAEFQTAYSLNADAEYLERWKEAYFQWRCPGTNDVFKCLESNPDWIAQQRCEEQDVR